MSATLAKPERLPSRITFGPQPGPQTEFLSSPADLVIYGGAAGGGKSYGLCLEPLRFCALPEFSATIFRRTTKQVRNKGGLWDTAQKIYGQIPGAFLRETTLRACFPSGAQVAFAHLEYEKSIYEYDGAQFPLLGFDELQHFSREQFRYLLSRNRSTCGVPAYCRATCNPDPDSWILELVGWYVDAQGYPIKARSGVVRWFFTANEKFVTAPSEKELRAEYHIPADVPLRSYTFIHSELADNPALLASDPMYRANLEMQAEAERERLLRGNWKARKQGKLFRRQWFRNVDAPEKPEWARVVVGVDPSGGAGKGHDAQGIVAAAKGRDGKLYVLEDATCSLSPAGWGRLSVETYHSHQADVLVGEGNFGGDMVESTIRAVDRYVNYKKVTASRGKAVRAQPVAALYEKGLILHVGAMPELESELAGFDPDDASQPSPNRMDALVWAISELMADSDGALDYLRYLDEQDALKAPAGGRK